jgi:SAM-dependent methyltransferase
MAGPVLLDPVRLQQAIGEKMTSRITLREGLYVGPAVPALAGPTVALISAILPEGLSGKFREDLKALLLEQIEPTWLANPNGQIEVRWTGEPGERNFEAWSWMTTLESAYASWNDEEDSRFGRWPDTRVTTLAEHGLIEGPVLDLGAGDGRNARYLAERGLPVLAIELSPEAVTALRRRSTELPIEVVQGSVLDPDLPLHPGSFGTVLASGLTPHLRDLPRMRLLFEQACRALRPGGRLVVDVFLCHPGWEPDLLARQISQVCWTSFLTTDEAMDLVADLPLVLESAEDSATFEGNGATWGREPPVWHARWATGLDLFALYEGQDPDPNDDEAEVSPVRLVWWVFRRT